MSHKTILYLVPSCGFGGAETFLRQTAHYHNTNVYNVLYLCFHEGQLTSALRAEGKEVLVLSARPKLSKPLIFLKSICEIVKICKVRKVQLIHSTMAYAAIYGGIASMLLRLPHVWFQHGPITGWVDHFASLFPAVTIYVNSKHTEDLQRILSKRKRISRINLGIQENLLRLNTSQKPRNVEIKCRIGIVCRPQPQKGIELLIEAIAQLNLDSACPELETVALGFTCSDPMKMSSYEQSLINLASLKKVKFQAIAASNQVAEHISNLDILVSASILPEAFGFTLIEGMGLGTLVVAPNEGGPKEIIDNGVNGFLYEPRNPTDLARAIRSAISLREDQRITMLSTAKKKVSMNYLASNTVASLEKTYNVILEKT